MHPLQDIDAHTAELTKIKYGIYYHNSPELNGLPNRADDSLGTVAGSNGRERLMETRRKTMNLLDAFRKATTWKPENPAIMLRHFIGVLLLAALTGCVNQTKVPVRPVAVKVLDKESGTPLQGIRVYYTLHTTVFQKYILFVIPSIEPDIGPKIAYKASGTTDKDGQVLFHADNFMLPGNERFEIEEIIVNIDADMTSKDAQISREILADDRGSRIKRNGPVDNIDITDWYFHENRESRGKVLRRPNARYSGAIITSNAPPESRHCSSCTYGEGERHRFETDEHISSAFNGNSLAKEKDVITIYLKRI